MMEAEVRRSEQVHAAPRRNGPSGWRWAIATLAVVALILGATFAAHSVAARLRRPPATAAPSLPPLSVLAVTSPGTDYELTAVDTSLGHIVALAADRQPQCPPVGACLTAPPLDRFVILDGTTGQVLTTTPLTGIAATYAGAATYLTVDESAHRAYAVGPGYFAIISIAAGGSLFGSPITAGEFISSGSLPRLAGSASWAGTAFDSEHQQLFVMGSDGTLAVHQNVFPPQPWGTTNETAGQYSGLALDARDGVLYTLRRGSGGQGAILLAIDTVTLATVAQATLPADGTLVPLDPATDTISILTADGVTYRATYANGQITFASGGPADAIALGANATLRHIYVAHADDVQVLDASGKAIAALPVRVYGGATLLTDPTRNLLYLPANGGALIIAQDAATEPSGVSNANTAILLARAALPNYLPDTNQDPPFLDTETFWPGVTPPTDGGVARALRPFDFWIHFSDRGWTGPYHGAAKTSDTPLSGQASGYQVAFTITWQQLFSRTHTWTLDVASNGAVSYVSDSGDALP